MASCGNGGARGNPPSGRGRLWCPPHCDNQSQVKVSAVWHTGQTSWWWQRKSYICSARQVFSDSNTQKPFSNSIPASNSPSERLRSQYFDSNHSVKVTWRWSALEKSVHTHPVDSKSPQSTVWMGHGPWIVGLRRGLSILQTSLDIALTSPIGVLECGEDQERGYTQTILLSMTVMEGLSDGLGRNQLGWVYWPLCPSPWHIDRTAV